MGSLSILARAREAGLTVEVDRDRLKVHGPRRLAALAQQVLANKADILAILHGARQALVKTPTENIGSTENDDILFALPVDLPLVETIDIRDIEPCPQCDFLDPWQDGKGNWRCPHCDPPSSKGERLINLAEQFRRQYPPSRTRMAQEDAGGEQQGKNGPQVT